MCILACKSRAHAPPRPQNRQNKTQGAERHASVQTASLQLIQHVRLDFLIVKPLGVGDQERTTSKKASRMPSGCSSLVSISTFCLIQEIPLRKNALFSRFCLLFVPSLSWQEINFDQKNDFKGYICFAPLLLEERLNLLHLVRTEFIIRADMQTAQARSAKASVDYELHWLCIQRGSQACGDECHVVKGQSARAQRLSA